MNCQRWRGKSVHLCAYRGKGVMCREWEKGLSNLISIWLENMTFYNWILTMFLFISTGTYFKLLDLEISGDLEMIGDVICIYIYICLYMYIDIIHFILNMLALSLFTLRCSQISIFGDRPFSLIKLFSESGKNL